MKQMDELDFKFETYKGHWEAELRRNEERIHSRKFENDDLRTIALIRGTTNAADADEKLTDNVIAALVDSLKNPNVNSEDICSVLRNDLFEKQQLRDNSSLAQLQKNRRFTCRHLMLLKELFRPQGN